MNDETMMAVVKAEAALGFSYIEVARPRPGSGEVLVKVKAASACGTDSLIYDWEPWAEGRVRPPRIVGHEFAGEVAALGDGVTGVDVGQRVSAESHFFCGTCPQCLAGSQEVCHNLRIMGVDTDGAFAEYIAVPAANIWLNHPDIPDQVASLQEPFGNAVDTVLAEPVSGKRVLIAGAGPIGLMCAALARAFGAIKVIISDPNEYRLELAHRMGADIALNPKVSPITGPVLSATRGEGVDVFLSVSGNPKALIDGLTLLAPGGRASLLGLYNKPAPIPLNELVIFKKLRLYGITGRKVFATWQTTSRLLSSHKIDLKPLITHELRLDEFDKGFELMRAGRCGKTIFRP